MKYIFLLLFAMFILLIGVPTSEAELGPDLALVGIYDDIEGNGQSVTIIENYAYVTDGNGLLIFDIQDPLNITLEKRYDTYGFARNVAISGDYAYIAADTKVTVVNLVGGQYATIDDNGITWLSYVTSWVVENDARAYDIAIAGDYAYVAYGYGGLVVLDFEDTSNPTKVGEYDTDGFAHSVTISGNYAYLTGSTIDIINIEDPTNPTLVGSYNPENSNYATKTIISEDYAYVAYTGDGAHIINISEPNNPTFIGKTSYEGSAYSVAISGSHAYLACQSGPISGVKIVDIEDRSNPTLITSYALNADFDQGINKRSSSRRPASKRPVEKIQDRTITNFRYEPSKAILVERKDLSDSSSSS